MNPRTRFLAATTTICALLTAPGLAHAWGPNGHRIVAKIGQDNLSPPTEAAIQRLAGSQSLAALATWPDFIRSYPDWDCAKPWHFLTVDDDESIDAALKRRASQDEMKGCNVKLFYKLNMPNNVVAAIDYFSAILRGDQDKMRNFEKLLNQSNVEPYGNSAELTALILLVHFVGDIHQPLHVGRSIDRGGNSIDTHWFGTHTKLHAVWDSELINQQELGYSEFAEFLEEELAKQVDFGCGTIDWAQESKDARLQVYDFGDQSKNTTGIPDLSYRYAADHSALIKHRLYSGGIRLAKLLNSIYDNAKPAQSCVARSSQT